MVEYPDGASGELVRQMKEPDVPLPKKRSATTSSSQGGLKLARQGPLGGKSVEPEPSGVPRVVDGGETSAVPPGNQSRMFPPTSRCPACQSGMVAPGIRHSAECRRLRYAFDHPDSPEPLQPDPVVPTQVPVVPEPSDMEIEDESMVPREMEFDRRFKQGPPTTAEELEAEIRDGTEDAPNVAAYCLDFTCSDIGEPMASVLSLEGPPSWLFLTGPDFHDETVNSIKYYGSKEHDCVKKKLGGREVLIWRPDEVIDDVSLLQLDAQLGFEGMQSEIENMEKCRTGAVISAVEMERLRSSNPQMRLIRCRWVGAYKTATRVRARIVAKDIAKGSSARKLGISSPTPSIEALHTILALASTRGLKLKAMDVDHAFMHSPLPPQDVVVLKLPLSVSLPSGAPAYLRLSRALNGLRDASLHWINLLSASIRKINMWSDEIEPCCYQGVIRDQKGRLGIALLIAYVDDILVCSENDAVQDMVEKAIGAVVPLKVIGCIEKGKDGGGSLVFIGRRITR